jgi:phenylpyruvate tautomerase PptA (4-oxalocrotonate tautomerase family)
MPLVKVYTHEGRPPQYRKAVLDAIHDALVSALRIPENDRKQLYFELAADNFVVSGGESTDMIVIEVVMFHGRSFEAQKLLYETIVRNLGRSPGIKGDDIMIVLQEPSLENWGLRGGRPASELDLGFKIDV